MEILSDRFTTSTFQINMSNIENSKGPLWIDVISSRDFQNEHMNHASNFDIYIDYHMIVFSKLASQIYTFLNDSYCAWMNIIGNDANVMGIKTYPL